MERFSIAGSSVLVTGGTGSFGKKLIAQLLTTTDVRRVVVYSRDELKQFEMAQSTPYDDPRLRFFIGDVRDGPRLARALDGVDVVVHAAALKQVATAEYNPFEAIKTNVFGAQNIIEASIDKGVKRVIALSTDKAANPINLYGATKLCSDKLFVAGNAYVGARDTRFAVVRYGNVVGSRGSVVPFFLAKRKEGKLPITDERMTRFWITLDRGVEFVLQSLEVMGGGEIFVPKIPSMKIVDLAAVIAPGCGLETVGIRPGEKIHEVLVSEDDARTTVEMDDRLVIQSAFNSEVSHNWEDYGTKCLDGFQYSSDTNPNVLSERELFEMIANLDLPLAKEFAEERRQHDET